MRQLAWLAATPRADRPGAGIQDGRSRAQRLKDDGMAADLPPNPLPFVTDLLMEVGPIIGGGMGPVALGWRDIAAWQQCMGVRLAPWLARLLRRLSVDWLAASRDGEAADCPPPFVSRVMDEQRAAALDDKLRRAMEFFGAKG